MKIIPKFLQLGDCIDLITHIEDVLWSQYIWQTSRNNWKDYLSAAYDGSVLLTKLNNLPDFNEKISWKIQEEIGRPIDWKASDIQIHAMEHKAGVDWHADNHCDFGLTIYLNPIWKAEWGGLFQTEDDTLCPEAGLCVINFDSELHRVTPIETRLPKYRYSLQFFGHYLNEDIQEETTSM